MWQQYRKTFWPVQVLVAVMAGVCLTVFHMPVLAVVLGFALPMEGFAFIGAAWSYRLKRKIESAPAARRNRPLPPL